MNRRRLSPQQQEQRSRANRARHLNAKQEEARAQGPEQFAWFWWDAVRTLTKQRPELLKPLASHLHDFYQRHTQ
ncbi:hypothetical protein [Streptomyces nanshensis]|uniref:Uncharacterized protein n=1 Tax=Streptomyces nanshensis TaxID=518642 RepID=A0A1E7L230_9ACTN|nr:hypothetical protein [Streptomyces nanshensis]OEV10228.1 hypothetical protein AN218_18590 [Streptomyces nanshensis]